MQGTPRPEEGEGGASLVLETRPPPAAAGNPGPAPSLGDVALARVALRPGDPDGPEWLDSWGSSAPGATDSSLPHGLGSPGEEEPADVSLPRVGGDFLGFRLIAELGRGTFGRVYLGRQGELADRLVALKVSTEIRAESQKLARLQHTHIVPVYSVHRAGPLQAVCMPYFGSTTLADVLRELGRRDTLPASGKGLVSTLNDRKSRSHGLLRPSNPAPSGPGGAPASSADCPPSTLRAPPSAHAAPALQALAGMTYVEAVLWIGARLAEGLAHAHDRGILHRDLKPANVLLTDDGTPMLLDFNLAEDTQAGGHPGRVGGTLPYMAPEHLAAFAGLPAPVPAHPAVDARSDVYSLGVILYELLAGKAPFPRRPGRTRESTPQMIADRLQGPPSLCALNRGVSPGAEAIVRKCLEPDPARRYRSAHELADDLRRQLDHRPLRHARQPLLERARKWVRRHRTLTARAAALLALSLLAGAAGALDARQKRLDRARAFEKLTAFRADLGQARLLLAARVDDRDQNAEGEALARRGLGRYGLPGDPDWRKRPDFLNLPEPDRAELSAELGELLLLLADVPEAPPPGKEVAREALALNELAEECYPPGELPRALWVQRAYLAERLGRAAQAKRCRARAKKAPARGTWDHYLLAHRRAREGDYPQAVRLLRESLERDGGNFAAWYLLGNCRLAGLGEGHEAEAVSCYTACLALRPGFWGCHHNRGLAHLQRGELAEAERDFTRALALRPSLAPALFLRAVARRRRGRLKEALADLDRAIELGGPARAFFVRAQLRRELGEKEGAERDEARGLKRTPGDEESFLTRGLFHLARGRLDDALKDFRAAARLSPHSVMALQNQAHVLSEHRKQTREAVGVLGEVLKRQPGLAPAWGARAVLHARLGARGSALADARAALAGAPDQPVVLYQAACAYALTSKDHPADREEALRLLARALKGGFGHDLLATDDDLAPLRKEPRFRELVNAARALRKTGGEVVR